MQRLPLAEITERTCKKRDAWWTVVLVDPLAVRLVRLVYPYRWITPNLLSGTAFVLGLITAYCFFTADRWLLVAGAVLFHIAFVIDCMDGKIARLNGSGSMFGAWFDFIFDRVRVVICAIALFAGQYDKSGDVAWVWLAAAVIGLDLFRYVNGAQIGKTKSSMSRQLSELRGQPVVIAEVDEDGDSDDEGVSAAPKSAYERVRNALLRRRIRIHLFSGIEFEMTVFIVGTLIGFVFWTTIVACVLLLAFEALLIFRLLQLISRWERQMAAVRKEQQSLVTPQPPTPTPV